MSAIKRVFAVILLLLAPVMAFGDPLDINTATADQLAATIVGVGKAKAEAIVKDRETNGPFKIVDDLERVKGIGKATVEKNKDKLAVKAVGTEAKPKEAAAPAK